MGERNQVITLYYDHDQTAMYGKFIAWGLTIKITQQDNALIWPLYGKLHVDASKKIKEFVQNKHIRLALFSIWNITKSV